METVYVFFIVFRTECLPPPALGGSLPFLTPEQFWPNIVFNPAAASAFLLGLPWHHHAQPSPTYQSSIHKALSQRIMTAGNQWPVAAQTSSSEPHSPSSAESSTSPAPLSPVREFAESTVATTNVTGIASPDRDGDAPDGICPSPPVLTENVSY